MSNLNELETLYDLKKQGILSEDEFNRKKEEILNSSPAISVGEKHQAVYCVLAFFLGSLGIHNFYAGRWKRGLAQLLLTLLSPFTFFIGAVVTHIWVLINIFRIHTDGKGTEFQPSPVAKYICGILGILWTLAYLGVLSVGGFYGYTKAMSKYRTDEVANTLSMLAVISHASNGGQGSTIRIEESGLITNIGNIDLTNTVSECDTGYDNKCSVVKITVSGWDNQIKEALCATLPSIAPTLENKETIGSRAIRYGYYIDCYN